MHKKEAASGAVTGMVLEVDTSLLTVRLPPELNHPRAPNNPREPNNRTEPNNPIELSNLTERKAEQEAVILRIELDIRKLPTFIQTTSGSGMNRDGTMPGTTLTGLSNMDDFRAASGGVMFSALGEAVRSDLGLAGSSSVLPRPTTAFAMIGCGTAIRL